MEFYFLNALAPATRKSYASAKNRYLRFCAKAEFDPVPPSELQLCRFVAQLAKDGLAASSIKSYLSAVRHLHLAMHLPDPKIGEMGRLEQVIKGSKCEYAKLKPGTRERLPITPELLLKMRKIWEKQSKSFDNIMLWVASCLCFFGFLRAGELTVPTEPDYDPGVHLNFSDVAVDSKSNPSLLRVHIKASKTDPFRKGIHIFMGTTGNDLCPVNAMLAYLARRGPQSGPLFLFENGRFLTRDRFVRQIKSALTAAGVSCKHYSGHSFRIGAASTAASRGIPEATIKTLGRWESSAYLLYIKLPREQLAGISKAISK